MKLKLVKGLLMALALIWADYQQGAMIWSASILVASCFLIGYYIKNIVYPSISEDGVFDWRDVVSGVSLAVVAAIGDGVKDFIIDGHVVWFEVLKTAGAVIFTYFTATFGVKAQK